MDLVLDQALYGYDEGHRRLSSSRRLDSDADRILRVVTDLKVASPERSYLTVVPLRSCGLHAFIRTWSAGPGFRPGSVWSHVLLMAATDLEQVADLGNLLQAFRRPNAAAPTELIAVREEYQSPVRLRPGGDSGPPPANAVARQIVAAAYSREESSEVVVDNAGDHERLLLALITQGWPELRRSTALRTRHRRTVSSAVDFSVEVVERPSVRGPVEHAPTGAWIDLLTRDLEIPDTALRHWLRRFGSDADVDRTMMPVLVEIFRDVHVGNTADALERIRQDLPVSDQLPTMKQALFGRLTGQTTSAKWPSRERDRLAMLISASKALDLVELDLETRLVALVSDDEPGAIQLATTTEWGASSATPAQDAFFATMRDKVSAANLATLAVSLPDEADFLLRTRPDAWSQAKLWADANTELVVRGLVLSASDSDLRATFVDLVLGSEVEAASTLVSGHPRIWWSLLASSTADRIANNPQLIAAARRLLEIAGPGNLAEPEPSLSSPEQLEALVMVSEPDMSLWRHTDPRDWILVVKRSRVDSPHRTAAMAIALASAEHSKDVQVRGRAWQTVFGDLHKALKTDGAPEGVAKTLDRALPGGPSWDWCGRLREGLARVAIDAGWTAEQIKVQANEAGDYAVDVADRVQRRIGKENGGLLDAIARLFRP